MSCHCLHFKVHLVLAAGPSIPVSSHTRTLQFPTLQLPPPTNELPYLQSYKKQHLHIAQSPHFLRAHSLTPSSSLPPPSSSRHLLTSSSASIFFNCLHNSQSLRQIYGRVYCFITSYFLLSDYS